MWTVPYSDRFARISRNIAALFKEIRNISDIFAMRFSSVTSASRWRILGINFKAMHRSRKNGEWHETVEGDERRFSGCRLQIPWSSRRNLHPEGLWQPIPARATTFAPLSSSLSSPFFDSVIFLSSSYHRIFLSSLFLSESLFLFFFLAVYIQRYFSVHLRIPFWYAENVE